MPTRLTPIWASKRTAAALLDMKPAEFLSLVQRGVLPKATNLHGFFRWRVAELEAIGSGVAMDNEDFEP